MSTDTTRYAVTIVYSAHVVVEVDANSHMQAEYRALMDAGIDPATWTYTTNRLDDRTGTGAGRAAETVTLAGREVCVELQTTYSREAKPARPTDTRTTTQEDR